ncbi:MAG TPA: thioredoxin family protein [Ktedonobacterales bacterium]
MAVTRERLNQGMTYDQYKSQMTRNQERFEANEQSVKPTAQQLAPVKNLPQPLDVLVLAEDWCGDVIDNLPILGRLAQESGKLNLHVFLRDQNLDLIDQYLNQGKFRSIPVFVFFDGNLNELGRFIERPESVTERRAKLRRDLSAEHPEYGSPETSIAELPEDVRTQVMQAMADRRAQVRPADQADVIAAIDEIVGRVPAA